MKRLLLVSFCLTVCHWPGSLWRQQLKHRLQKKPRLKQPAAEEPAAEEPAAEEPAAEEPAEEEMPEAVQLPASASLRFYVCHAG